MSEGAPDVEAGPPGELPPGPPGEQPAVLPPEEVDAQVRRRRRGLVLGTAAVIAAYVVFVVVLSLVSRALPTTYAWVLLAVALVLAAVSLWPLRTPAGRAAWDERTGRLVRIDAVLAGRASPGDDERDDVTAAARHRHQAAGPAWFGYPLLALFIAYLLFDSDAISLLVAWLGTLAAVVLCALGLLRSRHRDQEARRWLDALPPED